MRGRQPVGPEGAMRLEGSDVARERLRVLLEVVAGRCRVGEACGRLGVSASRLAQLRRRAWEGALAALEPRPGGRPPDVAGPADEQIGRLEARIRELER